MRRANYLITACSYFSAIFGSQYLKKIQPPTNEAAKYQIDRLN